MEYLLVVLGFEDEFKCLNNLSKLNNPNKPRDGIAFLFDKRLQDHSCRSCVPHIKCSYEGSNL